MRGWTLRSGCAGASNHTCTTCHYAFPCATLCSTVVVCACVPSCSLDADGFPTSDSQLVQKAELQDEGSEPQMLLVEAGGELGEALAAYDEDGAVSVVSAATATAQVRPQAAGTHNGLTDCFAVLGCCRSNDSCRFAKSREAGRMMPSASDKQLLICAPQQPQQTNIPSGLVHAWRQQQQLCWARRRAVSHAVRHAQPPCGGAPVSLCQLQKGSAQQQRQCQGAP
jgi:hypothetical protein